MYAQSLCKVGRDREPLKFQILVNECKGCVGGSSKSQAQEKEHKVCMHLSPSEKMKLRKDSDI
jgi:hypothetical protein